MYFFILFKNNTIFLIEDLHNWIQTSIIFFLSNQKRIDDKNFLLFKIFLILINIMIKSLKKFYKFYIINAILLIFS